MIHVEHAIGDLVKDLAAIVPQAKKDLRGTVREALRVGNTVAKDNARRSAGSHGKHYPQAFSAEMHGRLSPLDGQDGAELISGEYGPDISKPQGQMSFETGSRNQPPHLDLARSADLIAPAFAQEVRGLIDRWFW